MEYICDLCGKNIKGDSLVFIDHSEQHIVDIIKSKHPEWIETDGICQKCFEYYRKQLRG